MYTTVRNKGRNYKMQERKELGHQAGITFQLSLFTFRNMIVLLLSIIGSSALLLSSSTITRTLHGLPGNLAASKTMAINGANRWNDDTKVTVPTFDFSPPGTQALKVSPLFERYYHSHNSAKSLGTPLTIAFPTDQGWIQFFGSGALLIPAAQQQLSRDANDPLSALIATGMTDLSTGIIRLPLLQGLLTVGSQVPIGGAGSSLTYIDLRKAIN